MKRIKNKFMQRPKENGYEFVTRIMKGATNKGERLSARQVRRLVDQRGSGKMNTAQVQSHLRYAAERTGLIIKHKDKIVCPIRKRKVDTYSYNYTGIPDDEKKMDKAFVDFAKSIFNHDKKDQRDALVSTVQHHFTAEQLVESLGALNPDLHDAVLITIAKAMGKTVNGTDPIECMSWDYSNGNLVVKE